MHSGPLPVWMLLGSLGLVGSQLSACSAARLRVGAIGAGVAIPARGPGLEYALSDTNGDPLISGSVSVDLQGVMRVCWEALWGLFPRLGLVVASNAPTPTGPPDGT